MDTLARHLHLTSVPLVIRRLHGKIESLDHADRARAVLAAALVGRRARALLDAVGGVAPTWTPAMRDALLLLTADAFLDHAKNGCGGPDTPEADRTIATLRAFVGSLPPPEDATVGRKLRLWGLVDG